MLEKFKLKVSLCKNPMSKIIFQMKCFFFFFKLEIKLIDKSTYENEENDR